MAKNKVIAGDYNGKPVSYMLGLLSIQTGFTSLLELNKATVKTYELMDENSKKSAVSAVGRSLVGGFLLGPAGLFAGVTAKSKGTHIVAIEFNNGKRSLLEIDDKIYKALMKKMF